MTTPGIKERLRGISPITAEARGAERRYALAEIEKLERESVARLAVIAELVRLHDEKWWVWGAEERIDHDTAIAAARDEIGPQSTAGGSGAMELVKS